MKNKLSLKKYLFVTFINLIFCITIFAFVNTYEYNNYKVNTNKDINNIINMVKDKYPKITEQEIVEIINAKDSNDDFVKKYGIDINKDSLIAANDIFFKETIMINIIIILFIVFINMLIFMIYNKRKNKEITRITNTIEQINNKNYKIDIDEMAEGELAILKSEIYKATIMLKEQADNSTKDKIELKKSLEDISHQIKTPITSILVMLDNIIDDEDMEKEIREDFIKDIKRDITNISFLIQSLLKLSKLDTNTISYIDEDILLSDLVKESVKNVSSLCDLRNININIVNKGDTKINCDVKWQVEAITNIIKNCIEHSFDNSSILITTDSNKVYDSIIIRDYGTGINKKDLPHIFERFYKGKNTSKESVGIGLSLAKSIIEKNNGKIIVDTSTEGSIFTIKYFKFMA